MSLIGHIRYEEVKTSLVNTLIKMGLQEHAKVINDKDLEQIIRIMIKNEEELNKLASDKDKLKYLEKFILNLLAILIVEYGINLELIK